MSDEQQKWFELYLQEYRKLKEEQAQRIGFRDNLLYVTLALYGTVLAFALGDKANPYINNFCIHYLVKTSNNEVNRMETALRAKTDKKSVSNLSIIIK